MPHCTTNLAWYLGKFIIGFTGMLFLYVSFLKENSEKSCVRDTRMRELLRQKSEQMQSKRYLCGCNKPVRLMRNGDDTVPAVSNEFIKHKKSCPRSRCYTRRNSY